MPELPSIFISNNFTISTTSFHRFTQTNKWAEFVAHLSQLSEMSLTSTHQMIDLLKDNEPLNSRKATLLAGIGRCQIHEGDLITGAKTLGYASSLATDKDLDTQSLITMEMSSFLAITGQYDLALILLDRIPKLTKSIYLLKLANYYRLVLQTRKGDYSLNIDLINSAEYFKEIKENATLAYHYKNIGNIYRKQNKYDEADTYYIKALEIAQAMGYRHIESAVTHDQGMLRYHQHDFSNAIKILDKAHQLADSHYTKSFILMNTGYLHFGDKNWQSASSYLQDSMKIVTQYNLYFLLPSLTYLLGKSHDELSNPAVSIYYYRKGYESAMELLTHHFPCTGFRKKVINIYVKTLSENHDKHEYSESRFGDISFAIDKTLQQIRAIFQGSVFETVGVQHKKVDDIIADLGIPRRTYFDTKKRINRLYPGIPQAYCVDFYNTNSELTWSDLNQKFDFEICSFLFEKYKYNKTVLSKKLSVSYTHAIKLTDGMSKPVLQTKLGGGMQ
jgi:tetratricopeptide (TPR) repeat protein